jgi:glycosyl transferase family 2
VVVVADGIEPPVRGGPHEVVRTSAALGRGAALNIGIRRAAAPIVVVLDPSIVPAGDVVTPLVDQLQDPTVAIAGPFGLASTDLRRFEEVVPTAAPLDVAAIQGELMAFRRADAAVRGPVDEAFRFYRSLDTWWSLVLRDEGEGRPPRRAVAVPGLDLERTEPAGWRAASARERDRLSRRNAYRVLDRFRTRLDLAVPPG